jgi:hypothetical protein
MGEAVLHFVSQIPQRIPIAVAIGSTILQAGGRVDSSLRGDTAIQFNVGGADRAALRRDTAD